MTLPSIAPLNPSNWSGAISSSWLVAIEGLAEQADARLEMTRETFNRIAKNELVTGEAIESGNVRLEGDAEALNVFMQSFDENPFVDRLAIR